MLYNSVIPLLSPVDASSSHTQKKVKRRETHFELFSLSLALSWERSSLVLQRTERRRRRQKRKWKSITVVVVVAPARSFLHVQDSRGRDAKEGGHCLPRVWIFFFYTRETTTTTTSTMLCYIDYGRAWNMRRTPKTWRHNPPPCFFLLFLSRNNNNDEDIFNIYIFFFFFQFFMCPVSGCVLCLSCYRRTWSSNHVKPPLWHGANQIAPFSSSYI